MHFLCDSRSLIVKTIVIISANAEWRALVPLFPAAKLAHYPYGEYFQETLNGLPIAFFHTGWGKTASAGALQHLIDKHNPDLVINLGTCGGFAGVVEQGDLILVERTFMYDIVELMSALDISDYYASDLDLSWLIDPEPFPTRRGLIASADSDLPPDKIEFLKSHGAIAADWESAALAWVARKNNTRLLILRMVSDIVSEDGGEAYDNIELFHERTKAIMKQLVEQLPEWVKAVKL
jgi:adenosylhomocysteine nucleosidase